jgi:hypothetical protein
MEKWDEAHFAEQVLAKPIKTHCEKRTAEFNLRWYTQKLKSRRARKDDQ